MRSNLGGRLRLIVAAVGLTAAGCSNSDSPTAPAQSTPPTPDSPVNAVRLLEWCWEQQSSSNYAPLLTADFAFVFSPGDSAGEPFPNRSLTRGQELSAAQGLFSTGTSMLPKASAIRLDLGTMITALPDPRPGKNPTWHQIVDLRFDLSVIIHFDYRATGGSTFYLVREDSAQVPLESRAATGDTTHSWYLERWEERPTITAVGPGLEGPWPQPYSTPRTWGDLKSLYLVSPAGASVSPTGEFGGFGSP